MSTPNNTPTGRDEITSAVTAAFNGATRETNAIASIAHGIIAATVESNGAEFTANDVPFNKDTLGRYARGTLPTGKNTDTLPTAARMIDALADMSQSVRDARDKQASERASAKSAASPIIAARHNANAENYGNSLNTLKAPIRRAMMVSAYVLSNDAYAPSTAHVGAKGVLYVGCDTGEKDDNGGTIHEQIAVTYALAKDHFKGSTQKRKPGGQTNATPAPAADPAAVTFTPETVKRGGKQRDDLSALLTRLTELLSVNMKDKPRPAERAALMNLYLACENKFDAQALEEIAKLRDAN